MTPFLAFVPVALLAPMSAQAAMRAEFAAPFQDPETVIVDGRLWSCSDHVSTSRDNDPRPAITCRKPARKLGAVTRFVSAQVELNADGLATCHQDGK